MTGIDVLPSYTIHWDCHSVPSVLCNGIAMFPNQCQGRIIILHNVTMHENGLIIARSVGLLHCANAGQWIPHVSQVKDNGFITLWHCWKMRPPCFANAAVYNYDVALNTHFFYWRDTTINW